MIQVVKCGDYQLTETKNQTKILTLNKRDMFVWMNLGEIGEIIITSHVQHRADYVLAQGCYRMYEVKGERNLTDLIHLELATGGRSWQGYLLPHGFPNDEIKRTKIIATDEVITKTKNDCGCGCVGKCQ